MPDPADPFLVLSPILKTYFYEREYLTILSLMEREYRRVIRQKIVDALVAPVPAHTRRDIHMPGIPDKAMAVIGMRLSGKATFLWQCLAERHEAGIPRDALLYFN